MDADERAFYEGKHLEAEDKEEPDVALIFRKTAQERQQRIDEEREKCELEAKSKEEKEKLLK